MTFFKKIREGITTNDADLASTPLFVDLSKVINAVNNKIGLVAIRTDSEVSAPFSVEVWVQFDSAPEFSQNLSSLEDEWIYVKNLDDIEPKQYYLIENIPAGKIKLKVNNTTGGTWDIHASFPDNR